LLEPIVVRPARKGFEVVAGARRLEACKKLRLKSVLCHIIELDDKEAFEVSLIENIQRRTLDPIEEATAFKNYVEDYGYGGVVELARRISKSHSYVSNRIALLELPDIVKEEIVRRRTSPSAAAELLSLGSDDTAQLTRLIVEGKVKTRRDVRYLARLMTDTEAGEDGIDLESNSYYQEREIRIHRIDRTIGKCIAALREDANKYDDAMNSLDGVAESWVVTETLIWCKQRLNTIADELIRLRRKFKKANKI
jgi:ParB family chromosome partitioning protein